MNLIELCVVLLLPTTFVLVAVLLLDAPLNLAILIAFGLSLAYVAVFVLVLVGAAVYLYVDSWRNGRPYIPGCDCGATMFNWAPQVGAHVRACACGRHYVRRGLQCLEVGPGGATRPYRRWLPFRRWIDDSAASVDPAPAPYRDPHAS